MKQEVSIREMESLVEDYIYDKKGVRVSIDIQKGLGRNRFAANYLKEQVIKLNIVYSIALEYFKNETD